MRTTLLSALVLVATLTLACTGKKDTPGIVGNQYPHEALDVTGSPYQAYSTLESRAGVNRDTLVVRGPSLIPVPAAAPAAVDPVQTEGGVKSDVDAKGATQGGTTK